MYVIHIIVKRKERKKHGDGLRYAGVSFFKFLGKLLNPSLFLLCTYTCIDRQLLYILAKYARLVNKVEKKRQGKGYQEGKISGSFGTVNRA